MANVVVIGAGPTGLVTAMLLAKRGMQVMVLDRDGPAPESVERVWDSWERRSVAQFHQVHLLQPAGRALLEEHLPLVIDELTKAGAVRFNVYKCYAQLLRGGVGEFDYSAFETLTTCRRPVLEFGFLAAARSTPGVVIRNDSVVTELATGASVLADVPHVVGVKLKSGETVQADLVVDAGGRRTPVPALIEAAGGRRPVERVEDQGFAYNTRYYRGPSRPEIRGDVLASVGSFSVLTMPGDQGYWSVTIYHSPSDKAMRRVRDPQVFDRVVRSMPLHAHWVDGEAMSEVVSMASTANTTRQFVSEGRPCVTGLVPIGDAWGFTNPSLGRGITLSLKHATSLAPIIADNVERPEDLALAWERETLGSAVPWHDATVQFDRIRGPEVEAFRQGLPDPFADNSKVMGTRAFASAGHYDQQVNLWQAEIASCYSLPIDVISREGVLERAMAVASENPPYTTPGPDRVQLEALLT